MSKTQSVERAFAILKVVAANHDGMGVTEIARQVGLPNSTVSRLLTTLENLEAVERVAGGERLRIGPGTIALALGAPFYRYLMALARPYLLELTKTTGEAAALCVLDGDQMHVVDMIQTQRRVQVKDATGERFPLHATSPGKVLLAYWLEDKLEGYLSRPLQRFTSKTITAPEELRRQLLNIREQGFVWTFEELDEIAGVAAPIQPETGLIVAAVNVYGPAFRFPPEGKADEIAGRVVETGRQIAKRMQGNW